MNDQLSERLVQDLAEYTGKWHAAVHWSLFTGATVEQAAETFKSRHFSVSMAIARLEGDLIDAIEKGVDVGTIAAKLRSFVDSIRPADFADGQTGHAQFLAAIRRMLLRADWEGRPDKAGVAALLQEFIWDEQAHGSSLLGQGVWNPNSAEMWAVFTKWLRAETLGQYRIFFPTYTKNGTRGRLVCADVLAVTRPPRRELPLAVVAAAPWTFYVPVDGFGDLPSQIEPALIKTSHDLDDHQLEQLSKTTSFLVALRPLSEHDVKPAIPGVQAWSGDPGGPRWLLSPDGFTIEGPSLGLAIAIAAWAASCRLSVPPLFATGEIGSTAAVLAVGGVPEKLQAVEDFRSLSGNDYDVYYPPLNELASLAFFKGELRAWLKPVRSLTDLFTPGILVDGFDDYRRVWGVVGVQ